MSNLNQNRLRSWAELALLLPLVARPGLRVTPSFFDLASVSLFP